MKDWLKRFFFYLGLGTLVTSISHFIDIFYNHIEFILTPRYLGGYILIMVGLSILAAFVIKIPKKEEKKN